MAAGPAKLEAEAHLAPHTQAACLSLETWPLTSPKEACNLFTWEGHTS